MLGSKGHATQGLVMLALEWLHPCVCSHVDLQVGKLCKGFPTLLTSVLHYFLVNLVSVSVQGVLGGEYPFTLVAVQLSRLFMNGFYVSF